MKGVKGKVIVFFSLIIILILIVTWFFPFSIVSVYKNINYTSDSDSVRHHIQKLDDLQTLYDASLGDGTTLVLQNLSGIYEQDWLVENETFKMNKDELAKMLLDMQQVRKQLLNLTTQEDYSLDQRRHLLSLIEDVMSMEEMIESMMDARWENRTVQKRQFRNLSDAYTSSLMIFNTFYGRTQK